MPEMDSLEASRAIHQRWSKEQQLRIIAIIAYALKDDREMHCRRYGGLSGKIREEGGD
jgi:CheY-like chemotaxis protein